MSDVLEPKNRVWRKRGDGLSLIAKGNKELAGGKQLHLLVAIAHGKGAICAEPCVKRDSEPYSVRFMRCRFHTLFDVTRTVIYL